jgi:hypothetical protein
VGGTGESLTGGDVGLLEGVGDIVGGSTGVSFL